MPVLPSKIDGQQSTHTKDALKTGQTGIVETVRGRFIVEDGVPMPDELPRWNAYPFATLGPGQAFTMPWRKGDSQRLRAAAWQWCKFRGMGQQFRVLVVENHGKRLIRCWRLGPPAPQEPEVVEVEGPINL